MGIEIVGIFSKIDIYDLRELQINPIHYTITLLLIQQISVNYQKLYMPIDKKGFVM